MADHFNKMIGELKKSREELEEINRDLEKKVKDRTLQLEERNLAVKEAQEALLHSTRLAAVGEMAGLAAHEVLNPLTSIISKLNDLKLRLQTDRRGEAQFILDLKQSWQGDYESGGFSQLVKAWEAPSSVQPGKSLWQEDLNNLEKVGQNVLSEFDQLIHDSEFLIEESQRINRIIQSLRGMNAAKADVRQFSAHRLCERSITIMADLASKHNVEIQRQFTATEDLVWVDEDEMIQVLTNLIRNAIQSIQAVSRPYQKGQILIKTELDVESKKLILKIRDNGTGIGKETGEKLFSHRFTTKTKTEGTGIGLSLSRRLARGFNGDLKLSWTKPGEGAEFTLEVPLAAEQTARSA